MDTLPRDRNWMLLTPDNKAGQLRYRDEDTGEEVLVPSIWYNQPPSWRLAYFRFCVERRREAIVRLRQSNDRDAQYRIMAAEASIRRLEIHIAFIERTGDIFTEPPSLRDAE